MTAGRVIRSSAYYQNQYNEGVPDEYVSASDGCGSPEPSILTQYTEIDEILDKQDRPPKEKKEEAPDDIYAPVHDYRWAQGKAFECEHCLCEILPGWHLVYAQDRWTLRRYDKQGFTIETLEPTFEALNSRKWSVWNYKAESKK